VKLGELVCLLQGRQTQNLHFSRKQGQNFIVDINYCGTGHVVFSMYANLSLSTFRWVVRKRGTEHVTFVERNI